MFLHELPKIVKRKKRVGRGIGGRGAKSGRGMKGQRSRAGYSRKLGFEGGQTPLYMRLPKGRGTKHRMTKKRVRVLTVSTGQLQRFDDGTVVGPGQMKKLGWISGRSDRVKLIVSGLVDKKLTVRVHGVSEAAKERVEKAGGKVEIIA
ncbi:MAG: 50S ribosomal protein L15 [Candidatus Andersenbacteria bacterium]|nr:50S ribosomal protein L15 [bacterium]MDZ4225623.1 50S ribosomal protein L15 [Candidatus Andersenbacteria bacterium]